MTWTEILFSFTGRINRAKYWLTGLVYLAVLFIFIGIVYSIYGERPVTADGSAMTVVGIFAVLYLVFIYSGLAVGVKRLHDRNKSGWWLVLFYLVPGILSGGGEASGGQGFGVVLHLVSAVISIWALIELGFLRGTDGPNQYGPDPLAR